MTKGHMSKKQKIRQFWKAEMDKVGVPWTERRHP